MQKKDRQNLFSQLAVAGVAFWMLALTAFSTGVFADAGSEADDRSGGVAEDSSVPSRETAPPDPEGVKNALQDDEKDVENVPDGIIVGGEIKPHDRYRAYLAHAAEISRDLLHVRDILESQGRRLNLQQLGALTQRLSVGRDRFRESLAPGEETFETYRLINRAVTSLEEAIVYWRVANRYRPWLRGSLAERAEDEDILQLKLQAAVNAIDALGDVVKMRQTLSRDLDEDQ
jgi:hypothetical protein